METSCSAGLELDCTINVPRLTALSIRGNAGVEHVDLQFRQRMESHLQSGSAPRERLVLKMNTTHSSSLGADVPAYAQLQRGMHGAPRGRPVPSNWLDRPACLYSLFRRGASL